LPTVIATKVIQEEPLRVEEVGRFQGMITRQKLDQLLANAQNTNANGGQGQNGGTGSGSGGSSSGSGSGGSGGSGSGGGGAYSKKGLGILPLLILGFFAFRSRED